MRLALGDRVVDMHADEDGWFSVTCAATPGSLYQFVLPDGTRVSDPASRAQAKGVEGPSILTPPRDPALSRQWQGRAWEEAIIYEIHIGTFTEEGTFLGAIPRLAELAACGITAIELMPVAQFSGLRGWGYDGVLQFAPHHSYGPPQALKALIDAAHQVGLMVLLDVVYNHFGPHGNALPQYASQFFEDGRTTPWGKAVAFDNLNVRHYFLENALYWLRGFGFDGLRLDAVQHIKGTRKPDFLSELAETVSKAFPGTPTHLIVEDDERRRDLIEYRQGRRLMFDASWNDDFHHAAHTLVTQETTGHYEPYADAPSRMLAEAIAIGFPVAAAEIAEPVTPRARVAFLQNHDQVGNRAKGERLRSLVGDSVMDVLMSLLLLSPQIPLLFMGDDYGETQPFLYFADYDGELAEAIRRGRFEEAENFGWERAKDTGTLPDPIGVAAFSTSKLDWARARLPQGLRRRSQLNELTRIRARYVMPLRALQDCTILPTSQGVVAVDWRFDDGTLKMRANLSQSPQSIPRPGDAIIWSIGWHCDKVGVLAAPGIVVSVGPPKQGGFK